MTRVADSSPCVPHSDCSRWLAPLIGQQCSPTPRPLPAGSNHDQPEVIINCCLCLCTTHTHSYIQSTLCMHVCVHVCACVCLTSLSCGTSSKRTAAACPAAIFTASDLLSIRASRTGVSLSEHREVQTTCEQQPTHGLTRPTKVTPLPVTDCGSLFDQSDDGGVPADRDNQCPPGEGGSTEQCQLLTLGEERNKLIDHQGEVLQTRSG